MRRPVELQGKVAGPGEVQNRAQYLRPALDNQNSRMLAKAFSQMNSSLGRIASNEARLAERSRNDEYKDATEFHEQQNEMAKQLGALSAQTDIDYKDQFWNTPANLQAYNESNIVGRTDRSLSEFIMEVQTGPLYGNPEGRMDLQSQWTDYTVQMLEQTPPELQGEVAARLAKAGTDMLVKSDALAVENALVEIQGNATAAVRRSFLTSNDEIELSGDLLFERENLVKVHGNKRGNEMFLTALTTDMESIVSQIKPEDAQKSLDQIAILLSNEDFTGQFGSTEGGAIDQIKSSYYSAQRELNGIVTNLQKQAEVEHERAGMDLTKRAMSDWSNLNQYRDEFNDHYGMTEGRKKFKEMEDTLNFLNGADFMTNTQSGRIISAQNLRELKNEMDESNFDRDNLMEFVHSRKASLTSDDFEKLIQYSPKVPEAMDHPMVKALMADTAAMTDFAALVMGDTGPEVLKIGDDPSKSAIANAYKSFVRDYIERNAEGYNTALQNGNTDKFMNTMANDAASYILDYNFTGDENFTSLRANMNDAIRNRSNILDLSNNVAFRRYFATEELIRQVEEQEALAESSAANNPDLDRLESMVDDTVGLSTEFRSENSENFHDAQELYSDTSTSSALGALSSVREGLGDDDGDGIINAREDILTRKRVGRSTTTTATEATNYSDLAVQAGVDPDMAAIRLNNPGAITMKYDNGFEEKARQAFGSSLMEGEVLTLNDGTEVMTPKFESFEDGVRYIGFWAEHRGVAQEGVTVRQAVNQWFGLNDTGDHNQTDNDAAKLRIELMEQAGLSPEDDMSDPRVRDGFVKATMMGEVGGNNARSMMEFSNADNGTLFTEGVDAYHGKSFRSPQGNFQVLSQSRDELSRSERKSGKDNRIVSLDFNDFRSSRAAGVEIVIPDKPTAGEREAAQAYVDATAAFFEKHGYGKYPNRGVKTTSENGRGMSGYFHTEPFFVKDKKALEIIQKHPEEYAKLLAETLGTIGGVRFIAPHTKSEPGASGDAGSERDFALQHILPVLSTYQGNS